MTVKDIIDEAKLLLVKGDRYQAYRRLLMLEELLEPEKEGGASEKAKPPKVPLVALSIT